MRVLDASSIIYAWDNYPIGQFPALWRWIAKQIKSGDLCIPDVAYYEVEQKYPECGEWLELQGIKRLKTTGEVLREALRIKGLVGIVDDKYHVKGVGENDIIIIATARLQRAELVSDEERQLNVPKEQTKRKIPAVCAMVGVQVRCVSFSEFFKASREVFGQ